MGSAAFQWPRLWAFLKLLYAAAASGATPSPAHEQATTTAAAENTGIAWTHVQQHNTRNQALHMTQQQTWQESDTTDQPWTMYSSNAVMRSIPHHQLLNIAPALANSVVTTPQQQFILQ
jgi:hypothetical protein